MNRFQKNIISPSWELLSSDTRLKRFYLFPAILSVIFLTWLMIYQFTYLYVSVFDKADEIFHLILDFFESEYLIASIVTLAIFALLYIAVLPVYEAGLTHKIDRKDDQISNSDAISKWLLSFGPIFKYNNLFSEFKFISVLNGYLFSIRFIGWDYVTQISRVFFVIYIFSVIINVLFAYAKFYIILEKKAIFSALSESIKLSIFNISTTLKLYILMFILNIRAFLNFLLIFLIPIGILTISAYVSSQFLLVITWAILTLGGIVLIFILSYLTSVLEVFRSAVWYYAYKDGKKKMQELKEEEAE